MKRILFVDDEPLVLEGIRDLLRKHRRRWDMRFTLGGEAALVALEKEPFDVVVSDLRMPGMDGFKLLKHVQLNHPNVVRIVLSGQMDQESTLRIVPVAHQFLMKPCDAGLLENVIERSLDLQGLLADEWLRRTVGGTDSLPSAPRLYAQLTRALESPNTSAKEIADIVEQDSAMCARILQVANSAFFGPLQPVTSIRQAVVYLGMNSIRYLALSLEAFQSCLDDRSRGSISIDEVQRHALRTARIASRILSGKTQVDQAFMAAMLHDVGKLVLAKRDPERLIKAQDQALSTGVPLYRVEEDLWGITHAEVGAYLLVLWGLPYSIVEAVAYHHVPSRIPPRSFDALSAVYVADRLEYETQRKEDPDEARIPEGELDPSFMERLGIIDKISGWRDVAGREA